MTLCTSIDTLAMTYLDDELADEELRDFELHLRDCASCRGRVDAEREALAELRRQLAPPPMPDLARARLRAALDAEDAAVASRGIGAWLLPAAASVAAIAALALFVLLPARTTQPQRSAAAVVTEQQVRSLQVLTPVAGGRAATGQVAVHRAAMWQEQVSGHDVTKLQYEVDLPWGGRVTVLGFAFDARAWDVRVGQHVTVNGLDLWVTTANGEAQVFYQDPRGGGYAFAAPELTARDLVDLVGNYLVDDIGGR